MTAPFSGRPIRDVYFSNKANDTIEVVYNEAGAGQPESWISFFVPADLDSYTMKALIDEGYDFEKIAENTVRRKKLESALWTQAYKRYATEEVKVIRAEYQRKLDDFLSSNTAAVVDVFKAVMDNNFDQDMLFKAKLAIFDMPEIKILKDRAAKQNIRTAKSFVQLFAALDAALKT